MPRFPLSRRAFIRSFGIAASACALPRFAAAEDLYVSTVLATGFTSGIEGPACDADGVLYAVNYDRQGTIGRVFPDGSAEVFVELPAGSTGNGIRFGSAGEMYVADYTGHNVLRIDMETLEITSLAHDSTWWQPNDLAIGADGVIWASDPNWSGDSGRVIRVAADGSVTIAMTDIRRSNGIEVGPGESTLYVNESGAGNVLAFDITDTGLENKRTFATITGKGSLDGMRCDTEGNLFVATTGLGTMTGAVVMLSPAGEHLRYIQCAGGKPKNVAFGGPDGCTAFATSQFTENGTNKGRIETFRTEFPGRSWRQFDGTVFATDTAPVPSDCVIGGNFPNPFNPQTGIDITLARDCSARLDIYNVAGQRVRTLIDGPLAAGTRRVVWDSTDDRGNAVSSGVYIARLVAGRSQATHRMTLLR